jgi:hypothetical protein
MRLVAKLLDFLSEGGTRDLGTTVVRGLSLALAALLTLLAVFASGSGVYFCLGGAGAFLLTALLPRLLGPLVGGALLLLALLIALQGPNGDVVGLSAKGFLRASPLYLLGAVFMRPDIVTKAASLFSQRE